MTGPRKHRDPRLTFKLLLLGFVSLTLFPQNAQAIGLDLLGDVAKPLIGEARDKAQGIFRFIWLQPYGGYAFGDGSISKYGPGTVLSQTGGHKFEGLLFGGRGGIEIMRTFRIGIDYSQQLARREEAMTGSNSKTKVNSRNTMMGMGIGFDIPYTPVQAYGARYFSATLQADAPTTGEGWGYGINFLLANPFILLVEYRKIEFASDKTKAGDQVLSNMKQYYIALSFMLL